MKHNLLKTNNRAKEFLGQGLSFPVHLDASGQVGMASGNTDIEQSIQIVLGTSPGERLMRPAFGCRVYELLFDPDDIATRMLVASYVEEALARWEPRIKMLSVDINDDHGNVGTLLVEISYEVKSTHDRRSIIYPFYLMGEEE